MIAQLLAEVDSPNVNLRGELVQLLRQFTLVSLYFWLKYVCAYTGPYELLNEDLHLDMCNFRQSPACMRDGARFAGFIPRDMFKSTIFTHGGAGWEALRWPDIRIGIANAKQDRAADFMKIPKSIFENNDIVKELWPETVPRSGQERWNNTEIVMPNRTRYRKEPTIKPIGATGAGEGDHFDLWMVDDPVGMDDLNVD
jgi:hypothetical protein